MGYGPLIIPQTVNKKDKKYYYHCTGRETEVGRGRDFPRSAREPRAKSGLPLLAVRHKPLG